jgi:hypothetical protein
MSSPSEFLRVTLFATALAAAAVAVPAGTVVGEPAAVAPPERAAPPPTGPLFQVRCWQYGRLLFEEREVELSGDVVAGLKLRGSDRQRQPVMVTDTGNATCLIRRSPAPRK